MSRTRSMHPKTRQELGNQDRFYGEEHKPRHAKSRKQVVVPRMYPHRPLTGVDPEARPDQGHKTDQARALSDTVMLAIVGSMPRPNGVPVRRRPAQELAASTLSSNNLRQHVEHFTNDPNYDDEIVRQAIGEKVPSFLEPLGKIPVKDVVALEAPNNFALAIRLESPELQEEMDEASTIIGGLRGTRYELHSSPHITVARFPGVDMIPPAIISAVEEAIPEVISLDSGEFYARNA